MATKFTDAEKAQMHPNARIVAEIHEAYDRGDDAAADELRKQLEIPAEALMAAKRSRGAEWLRKQACAWKPRNGSTARTGLIGRVDERLLDERVTASTIGSNLDAKALAENPTRITATVRQIGECVLFGDPGRHRGADRRREERN